MKLQMKHAKKFHFPYAIMYYSLSFQGIAGVADNRLTFLQIGIVDEKDRIQDIFCGIVLPMLTSPNYANDMRYFDERAVNYGAIVSENSIQLIHQAEAFLQKYQSIPIYILEKRKLEDSNEFKSLCQSKSIHNLSHTIYLQDSIMDQMEKGGLSLNRDRIPFTFLLQLFHMDPSTESEDQSVQLRNAIGLVKKFRQGVELSSFDLACLTPYLKKTDGYGYKELSVYMERKKIIKAIHIAGCSRNTNEYIKVLRNAHFTEEEIQILIPYHSVMRYDYTVQKKLSNQYVLKQIPKYPSQSISKYLGKELFAIAESAMTRADTEKQYRRLLRKNQFTSEQIEIARPLFVYNIEMVKNVSSEKEITTKNRKFDARTESFNASKARKAGMLTEDELTDEKLRAFGFPYEADFFKWLRVKHYIIAKEIHHRKNEQNEWRNVYFYNDASFSYIIEHLDLEFLYEMYTGRKSYEEALKEKNISFCRVKSIPELLGLKSGKPVIVDCVRQNDNFWFSTMKYLRKKENNLVVLETIELKDAADIEKCKKIIRKLLSRKKRKLNRVII